VIHDQFYLSGFARSVNSFDNQKLHADLFITFMKMLFRMSPKDTLFSTKQTMNCRGRLVQFSKPGIMGILNVTPDSFYDGGKYPSGKEILTKVAGMLSEGADIIDVGAYSSRPGASDVSVGEEKERLNRALDTIRINFPDAIISVDTFRAGVAEYVLDKFGVSIINDISAGLLDENMLPLAGERKVPFIMMHMLGTPRDMQRSPVYQDVTRELLAFFAERIAAAKKVGVEDLIIDPGFGFGKTPSHNYTILRELQLFTMFGLPVMVGLSLKSMIYKSLHSTPEEALN